MTRTISRVDSCSSGRSFATNDECIERSGRTVQKQYIPSRRIIRLRRVAALSIVVCVGHRCGQCFWPVSYSRGSSQGRLLLFLFRLRLDCGASRRACLLLDSDWLDTIDVVVGFSIEPVFRRTMFTQTSDGLSFRHPHVSVSTFFACCRVHCV